MSNIFELTGDYINLLNMEDDIDEQMFKDTLESIEGEIEDKVDGYGKVITQLNSEIEMIKNEKKRLDSKKKVLENRVNALKDNLSHCMSAIGKDKIKTTLYTAGFRKTPASVYITDESLLDEDYFKIKREVSKDIIKEALKNGVIVEGAELRSGISFNIK